ncbi:trans-sulfuration enzyme family protein [Pseudactinotalea sp. Z1732]|uniref:trans-sulfuration enzyme family protein n=1 Tax=Pseudactinotalea sp. Z1732 TaxID=3413026 RepID=UPI003C7E225E
MDNDTPARPGSGWRPDTQVVAAGRPARTEQAPVNPPVVLSSTYVSTAAQLGSGQRVYTRHGTETWEPLEEALALLEGAAEPAVVFSSGMGAIDAALTLVAPGGHLVLPTHAYNATIEAGHDLTRRSRVRVHQVPIARTETVLAALREAADDDATAPADLGPGAPVVLWVESPTNPMLEVADLPVLIEGAHTLGALVVVDNTFATPLGQRPLAHGADVVVHSVTKHLAGHSDVLIGAALSNNADVAAAIRARRTLGGAIPGPWEAWLALRGLRTLALRLERASANAAELAARLEGHEHVVEVGYPGLASHPQHQRAAAQLDTFGSVITVRPRGGRAGAQALVESVRLWMPGTSLGGVESLLERRRRIPTEPDGVPENLVRLSVGIENVEDLAADLFQALAVAAAQDG